jgi:DNA polymerase-1
VSPLLLDGLSLLFRAFYALPPMSTRAGEPTGALYGFSTLLLKLLREEEPSGVAIALDTPEPTFRHVAYESYKAGRAAAPDPLRSQLARFAELLDALGVPVHRAPGFEADDVLASLARGYRERGQRALVVTGDTDLLQVARRPIEVLFVGRRQKDHVRYDEAAVTERYGVPPERLPTIKALAGDPSDHLPGILGIGARGASRLVARYGDARAILAAPDLPPKTRAALAGHDEALLRWEHLATVRDDLPVSLPWAAPVSPEAWTRVRALFEHWEFASLLKRIPASEPRLF